jgi:fructosamine-3-kinase
MGNIYILGELHPCNHKAIKKTNIKIAFETTNTIGNMLRKNTQHQETYTSMAKWRILWTKSIMQERAG